MEDLTQVAESISKLGLAPVALIACYFLWKRNEKKDEQLAANFHKMIEIVGEMKQVIAHSTRATEESVKVSDAAAEVSKQSLEGVRILVNKLDDVLRRRDGG